MVLVCAPLALAGVPSIHAGPRFIGGADVSSLPQVEAAGGVFRDRGDRGEPGDAISILRTHGLGGARLRLWHSPRDGACGLAATLVMARRLRDAGLPLLLDIHYSDTWADPAHQQKPAAWQQADFASLADSVRGYTRDVIAAFRQADALPECVQLGNEIGHGLLWPDGRIAGGAEAAASWGRLGALLNAAALGVREGAGGRRIRLMIHYENGGDVRGSREFFDHLVAAGVPFDVIGLSYYPWWHGGIDALAANLSQLHGRYGRDVTIVETGYPWSLGGWDGVHNIVGRPSQRLAPFAATPAGQRAFVRALIDRARAIPGCRGVYYWEPAWISAPRAGSPVENLALFDSTGAALPALRALARGR